MVELNNKRGDLHLQLWHSLDAFGYSPRKLSCILLPAVSVGTVWEHLSSQISDGMQEASAFPSLCCWQHRASAPTQGNTARTSSIRSITPGQRESSHPAQPHNTLSVQQRESQAALRQTPRHSDKAQPHLTSSTSPTADCLFPSSWPSKIPSCFLFPSW